MPPTGAAGQNTGCTVREQEVKPQVDGAKPEPPAGPGGPASQRLRAGEAQPVAKGGEWLISVEASGERLQVPVGVSAGFPM